MLRLFHLGTVIIVMSYRQYVDSNADLILRKGLAGSIELQCSSYNNGTC